MSKLDIVQVTATPSPASPTTPDPSTSPFTCRTEHFPITQGRNILGHGLPLYQQHIELTPRPLTSILVSTTGLTSDPERGSLSEIEIIFQRGEFSGQVTRALGGTRLWLAAAGDAETIRMAETLILAGQNLLRLVDHATGVNQREAEVSPQPPLAD